VPSLAIRPATQLDSQDLFDWRNDPQTRAVSLSTDEVTWDGHVRWFEASLANERRRIYICTSNLDDSEQAIGMVRFDEDEVGTSAEVSINLNPQARGRGLGYPSLVSGISAFTAERSGVIRIVAKIRATNAASLAIFTKAGFAQTQSTGDVVHFELSL